ncbi:aldehyde dehydrogenase [Streptomyces cellostaticus]|uniref:Aldehyde dehydrogenase n=1 Tax=Streptomyces cellostaticus TaxID=67285 RepID=A0A117PWH0_9ACTN|nr:aldehyde dehydrogenase [Streptomyces cellostaticus]KUM95632.1 aldehyde dehydrogenase [Streptomyces cellostaticus]GHI09778.1 putative aldehyde dehydrogenase [Streptomyces cellostaticus]
MYSYPQYIGGQDRSGTGWTYCLDAGAFLADPRASFTRKRKLELAGGDTPEGDTTGIVGRVALSSPQDVTDALQAAHTARRAWARTDLDTRMKLGPRLHTALTARYDDLLDILVREGHPRRLAEWEIAGMLTATSAETVAFYRSQLEQRFDSPGHSLALLRKPDGVVCLNPPQNAAAANSFLGTGALGAGNTLVVKAPRTAPLGVAFIYRELVAPILDELGAPPGTVNLVSGATRPMLRQWLTSPHVDDIMFFGDSDVGLELGDKCVTHGKKPVLELSGNDCLVVWNDADPDGAVEALLECFYGSGQICMVPKCAIIHPDIAEQLLDRLTARCRALRPGYPDDPEVLLSPVLKSDRFHEVLADARQHGCRVLCGGERLDVTGRPSLTGTFLEPTVVRVDGLRDARRVRAVREETFFPLLAVVVPDERDEGELLDTVIEFINENDYGLRNSLWSADDKVIDAFTREVVGAGLLKVNDSHIGFVPYLGTHGGTGRTGGPFGELNYPILRTSHLQGVAVAKSAPGTAPGSPCGG